MRNRNDLAEYFAGRGYDRGAEIGVHTGIYSKILCEANPNLELHCVDLWERRGGKMKEAEKYLAGLNVNLIQGASLEAVDSFEPGDLEFVYLDAAHDFDNIMRDIIEWSRIVRKGGIVAGHDYGNGKNVGVKDAVNTYCKHHGYAVNVLPEPDIRWTPKNPSDEIAGLTWWFQR